MTAPASGRTDSAAPLAIEPWALPTIALVSCSMLMYEILLTRVCALRLFFHFSFLVISNCLLAIGASGTMIALARDRWEPAARRWVARFALLYVLALIGSYVFLLTAPIDATLEFRSLGEVLWFSFFNLVAAVPFFFAGTVVGLILTIGAARVNVVYGADLLGAGLGCLLCPALLARYGAGGCLVAVAILGLAGMLVARPPGGGWGGSALGLATIAYGLWCMPLVDARFPVPRKAELNITADISAPALAEAEFSRWSATSRIDLIPVAPERRYLLARGRRSLDVPLPDEKLILQDGTAGTFILDFGEHPESLAAIERSMYSAALVLKQRPRVFVIGVGGGNDVWAAQLREASLVRGIELNQAILDIHTRVLPHFSQPLLTDARIHLEWGEGRSALMADPTRYDVIQMTGIDTWTALTSGAYVLAENYLYTREAIASMLEHLADGGILQITRFAFELEALRLVSVIAAAFDSLGLTDFEASIVCLRTPDYLMTTLVRKGPFSGEELARLAAFAGDVGVDRVYVPGQAIGGEVERFVRAPDKAAYVAEFARDISPPTDDRPYFFHFSRWRNPFATRREMTEPKAISQGNPFFILTQLALSAVLALGCIVAPLLVFRRRGFERRFAGPFLVYFAGLGMGFILIEIGAMQKLTLLLGQPLYSITVTLFAVLVFTGLGSLCSARWFETPGRVWRVPLALAVLLALFAVLSPVVVHLFVGAPLAVRAGVAVCLLAPICLLLGVPFAYGIRRLDRLNPTLVPWAWAVNGCFTVIGSIATVILSMNLGFAAVLALAAGVYVVAFAAIARLE